MKAAKALLGEFRTGTGLKGQLLRGGFWSLVIKLMSTLMALILAIVLARLLGAEGFGIYSFVFALVSILAIPAQLGLPNLVVRETAKAQVAERWDVMKGLWRWTTLVALAMSLLLIVIGGLAAWLFADQLGPVQTQTLWWGLALIPLVALGNLRGAALRGLRKIVQGQLPEFVLRPAFFILLALGASMLLGMSVGPAEAMILHMWAALVAFVIGNFLLLRERPSKLIAEKHITTESRAWLHSALPLGMAVGMQVINQNVGLIILGILNLPEQVALFRIATQGATVIAFVLTAVNLMIAPYIARAHANSDTENLQRMATSSARIALYSSIPITIIFIMFGQELLLLSIGYEYLDTYYIFLILILGQVVMLLFGSSSTILNMTGKEKYVSTTMTVSIVANITICLALAPWLGAIGCAIGASFTKVVWSFVLSKSVFKTINVNSAALKLFSSK